MYRCEEREREKGLICIPWKFTNPLPPYYTWTVVRRLALFLTTCRDSRNFISRCSPRGGIVTFLEIERLFLVRVGEKYYAMQEIRPTPLRVCGHASLRLQLREAFTVLHFLRDVYGDVPGSRKFLVWRERKGWRSFGPYSVILLRENGKRKRKINHIGFEL